MPPMPTLAQAKVNLFPFFFFFCALLGLILVFCLPLLFPLLLLPSDVLLFLKFGYVWLCYFNINMLVTQLSPLSVC